MRIAMIGTRGAPARYGGFETAVEEVGARLAAAGHHVTVYCRNPGQHDRYYRCMSLINVPAIHQRGLETLSHTALSLAHQLIAPSDVALVFNAANAPLLVLPRLRGIPVALNVDGVEWQRDKWGTWAKRYYRASERLAVALAQVLIVDSLHIQNYYREAFGADSTFIPYGAPVLHDAPVTDLAELGATPGRYHLVVARLEPENNIAMIIAGYRESSAEYPLVLVGGVSSPRDSVAIAMELARSDPRIRVAGSIWDQGLLDRLYFHAASYVHGHSAGGTNPSLLRAMGAGAPVIAFDVGFNREVLLEDGEFFATAQQLARLLEDTEREPSRSRRRADAGRISVASRYSWDKVALQYEQLCQQLAAARRLRRKLLW